MSEMELSLLRQRSWRHSSSSRTRRAAQHGSHRLRAYQDDRIEKDPDRRIREALSAVFSKFAELRSARQVLLWSGRKSISLPAA